MKLSYLVVFSCLSIVWAQPAPQAQPGRPHASLPTNLPADTVVATFGDGQKITFGELKKFMGVLPPQMQQLALSDRKRFVEQYVLMHHLADLAEKAKLDQESPTKEQLAFNRMYVMMNAELNDAMNNIIIPPAEQQKFYEANKQRFSQVKVKVIYLSFSSGKASSDSAKHRTEEEARERIAKLREQALNGADFVKLVKENSEDKTSAEKDGDFGTIRRSDKLPDAIRDAIFALKAGEISQPVRQPNGFYLFRAETITIRPFPEVQDEIFTELKQQRFRQWMEQTNRNLNVKYENSEFFNQPQAAPGPAAAPAAPPSLTK